MEKTIVSSVECKYGVKPSNIVSLGGGFYGRAFSVSIDVEPYILVVKLYLFDGIAKREAEQLSELKKYALLKMPEVFCVFDKTEYDIQYEALLMEYINGRNAGWLLVNGLSDDSRKCIRDAIVDNLISYHSIIRETGFGAVSDSICYKTWQEYYYPIAVSIVEKARALFCRGEISPFVMETFERSINCFDEIFCEPITNARLIHGDYNAWNIMLDEKGEKAIAVIDPCNCCYGDSEYDLYQLDNANGKDYGLLNRYKELVPLSENFAKKRAFYELYSEVCHYHDARVHVDLCAVEELAKKLNELI